MVKQHYYAIVKNLQGLIQQWTTLPELNPVLVYSMRKVGSTTITRTLRKNNIGAYKLHFLNPQIIHNCRVAFSKAGGTEDYWIVEGLRFRRRLERWRKNAAVAKEKGRLKIFTFVKDPVAIAISDFFMQLFYYLPQVVRQRTLTSPRRLAESFEKVMWTVAGEETSDAVVSYLAMICALSTTWFDKELKGLTGIDVYKTPYCVNDGITYYKGYDSDIALIRTDKLSQVGLDAINKLIGTNLASLITSNVRSTTAEGQLYKEFSQSIRLPEDLVRVLYARARVDHFYAVNEIDSWVDQWTSRNP